MAHYVECTVCRALQVRDPDWLAEVYRDEALPPSSNADSGRFRRNFSAYLYLSALCDGGLFPRSAKLLDFGGGYGLLTQMLLDGGYDAWTADEYVSRPFLATHRQLDFGAIAPGSFDVITAFEVFEHLLDPIVLGRRLASALTPAGTLILSTGLYDPRVHDEHWPYLAREGGQHITFWTTAALTTLARELDFASVGLFPGTDGFMIVLSRQSPAALRATVARAGARLRTTRRLPRALRPWDFRVDGVVSGGTAVFGAAERPSFDGDAPPRGRRSPLRRLAASTIRRLRGA
jgi:SAM-dependent methyltransferase